MDISPRRFRRGGALVAALAAAGILLFAGPSGTALAVASSNNLETTVSLGTNSATGSNTFTTLSPITLTCSVVDVTAGVADGVAGITLVLSAGWTFAGGTPPTITYSAWPAPDGQATGTIASAGVITNNISTSCSPGSVVTFTGVQVKPTSATSGNGTITADISTADVTVARITAQAATPTPTASPTPSATASPTATPTASPTASPTATPTASPTASPTATPTASPTATATPVPVVQIVVPIAPGGGTPVVVLVPVLPGAPLPATTPGTLVVLPPIVIPPGATEVVLPPVIVPSGVVRVLVPVLVPEPIQLLLAAGVGTPSPADTGSGDLSDGGSLMTVVWVLAALTAAFIAVARRFVGSR